ncbi:adenine deaminase C-terminal domain-containing protein [Sporosarcina aquimarina]|uniref:adenine deaminase n=1 Tax=Sporosarcina aquimarina TaxID=114975 RepID=A0ABU4G293_9BACL|nr:adenine deaminase C-terminal domain-containing protein [Sporosarcina aquimarina]MDW0111084.1 adenine deaminase C-terminal domain-containing protein [Sporosarcina aquimarina]
MWNQQEIASQLAVIDGQVAPDLIITNATYLHSVLKKWMTGTIWVKHGRILYTGERMPPITEGAEQFDATGKWIVPGYIEPHVHPFQLYNPETFAHFAAQHGTTTILADNLMLLMSINRKSAFKLLDELKQLPYSFYWWARMDSQTNLQNEAEVFAPEEVEEWLKRDDVLMGGELTGWPRLLKGDPVMTASLQKAKQLGKKVEGHFPGASERTLARMRLLGVNGDHESMTADEAEARLLQGYAVTLRESSIRPDLKPLLEGILEKGLDVFDHLMMTTDGSPPLFHEDGVMDKCIRIAMEAGVDPIDAYQMASYNSARYYDIDELHSVIAPGRFATLNVLSDIREPNPTDVLSKGVWLKRDGQACVEFKKGDWTVFPKFAPDFDLTLDDVTPTESIGINMLNDVITKPYKTTMDLSAARLEGEHEESFLALVDRNGKWRVTTVIKGFSHSVQGLASSYSNTGDVILIGRDKQEMIRAFERIKELEGGIVLAENEQIICELPLPIGGSLSDEPIGILREQERQLKQELSKRGYAKGDAIYSLLFLQSTHLPYIRITQLGVADVMKNIVLNPTTER